MSHEISDEKYQYLPFFDHNLGRVYIAGDRENTRLFIQDFRQSEFGSRLVTEGLAHGDNLDAILAETQKQFGRDEINMTEFTRVAKSMWMNGDFEPEKPEVAPVEPDVERDRLGRPLSAKAKQWKRWQEWCNNPTTTMKDIRELRRTDSEFAEFYANQSTQ